MPSIRSSDIPGTESSGKMVPLIIGVLLVCGVGYGIYHFVGPSTTQPVKAVAMPMPPEVNAELKKRMEAMKARQSQKEDQFKISLGLSNAQLGQLATIESETTNPRTKAEAIKNMMSAEQWEKYRQHSPEMRWAGGGWGNRGNGGGGPPADGRGRGGRRRGGDNGSSSTEQQSGPT